MRLRRRPPVMLLTIVIIAIAIFYIDVSLVSTETFNEEGKNSSAIDDATPLSITNRTTALSVTEERKVTRNESNCSKISRGQHTTGISVQQGFKNKFVFLHMGKAGGGTIEHKIRNHWKLSALASCHPFPCLKRFDSSTNNDNIMFLINIRDPVDRFVSAFYWRLTVLCNPDGDARIRNRFSSENPAKYCAELHDLEREILFHKYKQNINLLAEALCGQSQQAAEQAKRDVTEIRHARHKIVDWVGPNWKEKVHKLIPIVLEPNFDFDTQIDKAVLWAYNHTGFGDTSGYASRDALVPGMDCQTVEEKGDQGAKNHRRMPERYQSSHLHSSSLNPNRTALSMMGQKCLARYHVQDYELIAELIEQSCRFEECQAALQSILDRRAHLLKD